ncbi:ABC transporter permease [bacterium]|nr:ABC transporter permease [bacterium]
MVHMSNTFKTTATYHLIKLFRFQVEDFFTNLGEITKMTLLTIFYMLKGRIKWKEVIYQCYRFGVTSLPITLSIVGMTSIIVATQVASEMVKQGGENFVGMMITMLIIREAGIIMSGFAIISMIGSSLASEVATMRVTEQIDAIRVLKVNPIRYLFVPRVLSGMLMMPVIWVLSSLIGVLAGSFASNLASGLSYRAYFDSVWYGIYIYDIKVNLFKAVVYGFSISLISCTFGYNAKGGAKGVGIATTGAVVWSFVSLVILDMIFAVSFFF